MALSEFGQTLEKLQAKRGISNKELAERLGVTPSGISIMKRTRKPHPTTIHKLSLVFDVDAAIFFDAVR